MARAIECGRGVHQPQAGRGPARLAATSRAGGAIEATASIVYDRGQGDELVS